MTMNAEPIPVRQLHDDGYITVRYLNADGSRFEDELPEHPVFAANPHPITAIWDRQYRLGNPGRVMTHETLLNLLHLSDVDPLLFDELMSTLETCSEKEAFIWEFRLFNQIMHPTEHCPDENFAPVYRQMLRMVPVVATLDDGVTTADSLIGNARKTVQYLGHKHLRAAALCYWITERPEVLPTPHIDHDKHYDDLEFIDANFDAVMGVRDALKAIGAIDAQTIREIIEGANALNPGVL